MRIARQALTSPHSAKGAGGADVAGTGISPLSVQNQYAQEGAGPIYGQTSISQNPSFDIAPDIDSPEMDRWLEQNRPNSEQPLDMDRINRNIQRLREQLKPILRGA